MSAVPGRLRLYLAGGAHCEASLAAVRAACRVVTQPRYRLEVMDVRELGASDGLEEILLTPTLERLSPGPPMRWFGDLTDPERVAALLRSSGASGG